MNKEEELKKNQDSSQYGNINLLQQAQQHLQMALQNAIWDPEEVEKACVLSPEEKEELMNYLSSIAEDADVKPKATSVTHRPSI